MMYKKKKGFSLAELLISLLVISIVLAAAIPTITKRNSAGSEKIWHWAGANNSIYSAIGANQSVMIGANQMPHRENIGTAGYYRLFFSDNEVDIPADTEDRPFFTTDGDKLVLLKRSSGYGDTTDNFVNSHISFYNLENGSDATIRDITYAGRIASDEHNLAFGIGSLQNLNVAYRGAAGTFKGYNTAVGHYSLFYNADGHGNTAIGEKTLTYNVRGSNNTALGYNALNFMQGDTANSAEPARYYSSDNTAIGSSALLNNAFGTDNTAVGSYALRFQDEGSYNTALGSGACSHVVGDYNICIGFAAGGGEENPSDDKLIKDDNYLIIGNDPDGAPLVQGRTSKVPNDGVLTLTKDKQFNVNARYFNVQPFDGSAPILQVIANSGDDGYASGENQAKYGDFRFTLKEVFDKPNGTGDSIQLRVLGKALGTEREVQLYGLNHHENNDNPNFNAPNYTNYANFNFNNSLYLTMANSSNNYVGIKTADDKTLGLQETIFIEDDSNFKMNISKDNGFSLYEGDSGTGDSISFNKNDGINIVGELVQVTARDYVAFNAANGVILSESVSVNSDDIHIDALSSVSSNGNSTVSVVMGEVAAIAKRALELAQGAVTSDARLKNISGDSTAGLKEINALEVKNYTYKNDKEKTPHVGVIAQQLQKVFPNSVIKGDDGYLRIKTEEIFYAMVNSIKELFTQIQDLTAKITGLDKRISELEAQNKALKKQNEEFEKRLAKLEKQAAK